MPNVLVTGGAGFIGAALSPYLADTYSEVIALDNLITQVHPTGEPSFGFDPRVHLVNADVTHEETWERLLSDFTPDIVVHLAAETGTGQSLTESALHTRTNIVGTATMLDSFAKTGKIPKRIIVTSSRAVYGEGLWEYTTGERAGEVFHPGLRTRSMLEQQLWDFAGAQPCPMDSATTERNPASVYGITKVAEEDLVRLWADAYSCEYVILRPQNVYGVGQTPANPYTGIISTFCQIARAGKAIPLYEDGLVRRDYIYISDIARAIMCAMTVSTPPPLPIDLGSGTYTTLTEAASEIARIFNAPQPIVTAQWRHGDIRHAWANPEPAQQHLGFRAEIDYKEGFALLAQWISCLDEAHSTPRYH